MNKLIQILKEKHGYSEEESKSITSIFSDFIQKDFPEAFIKLSGIFEINDKNSTNKKEKNSSFDSDSYIPDSSLKDNQQLSKDKQSGFYEGNKRDY